MSNVKNRGKYATDPNSLASRIVKLFDLDPTLSSYSLARLCDTEAHYVRHVLLRRGRKLFRKPNSAGFKGHNEARKRSDEPPLQEV